MLLPVKYGSWSMTSISSTIDVATHAKFKELCDLAGLTVSGALRQYVLSAVAAWDVGVVELDSSEKVCDPELSPNFDGMNPYEYV